jgi:hypothetical protein
MLIPAHPIVAVVQLTTQMQDVLHQVTLRPDKVKGDLIRLGETPGDEANGWQRLGNVVIITVLGRAVEEEGKWTCVPEVTDGS